MSDDDDDDDDDDYDDDDDDGDDGDDNDDDHHSTCISHIFSYRTISLSLLFIVITGM